MVQEPSLYERLAGELAALIADRVFAIGERLPSVRRLATERRLSVATVVQALRRLEERGLVEARPQSGFYVRPSLAVAPLAGIAQPSSVARQVSISQRLQQVLLVGGQPGVVPLGAALPAPELLPLASLRRLYARLARCHPDLLGSAAPAHGEPVLIRQLIRRSLAWGGPLESGEMLVTNSCSEALALCLRAATRPGDTVAVESPAYYLMLQLIQSLGLKALEIPSDPQHGLSVAALELASRNGGIAACLLVANASNPLGSVLPDEAKRALAGLAAERGFAVIEDDIYGDLHFGERRPWPVKAFDRAGQVMLCASFAKSLSPALRLGYVAAGRYFPAVAAAKAIASGPCNPLTQRVLADYLESGAYDRHLRRLRGRYEAQVAAMQAAVARHFPAGTRAAQPQGGFVLWVELPEGCDATACHAEALAEGIAYLPGELFSASGLYRNCLRLNCGNPHTAAIEDAIRRLGRRFAS